MTWSKYLFDAKEAGTKVVSIDPRFSPTSAKADTWVPLKPGTDPALALAMVNVIADEGWIDEEYMLAYTGYPFLVDDKTGEIVGEMEDVLDKKTGEPQIDEDTGEKVQKKVPYVWDTATKSPKRHDDESAAPALEGSFTVDGAKCKTEYTLMQEQLAEYTPAWAAEVTGLDEQMIYDLAKQYASGPAFIAFGLGGPDKYTNADVLGHALLLMTAMTGNQGKVGSGTAWYGAGGATNSLDLNYWELPEDDYYYGGGVPSMYDFPFVENNVHAAVTFGDVFTLESGSSNEMLEWVKGLDFFAQVDIYHSSSVDYADIVLPACTKFECEEDTTHVRVCKGYVALGNKAIDPLFESKTDLQIEYLLAKQWDMEGALPASYDEPARHLLDSDDLADAGITYEKLRAHQGVMKISDEDPVAELEWGTPSGKLEPYAESMLDWDQAFPQYETPDESYEENPAHERFPFQFMQGKTRFRIHAYYSANAWFREYFGIVVNMNPGDAAQRGIAQDDGIEVFNDRGSFKAKANLNPGIMPGTLFMAESTYTSYYEDGLMQEVTNNARKDRAYDLNFGPQIPFNDTLVDIRKA